MNITVRVLSARAQTEVKALRTQVAALQRQLAAGGAAGAVFGGGLFGQERRLAKFGNQLQWTGRQLQYNFTLPILLAAGAATKFSLDNEKAFTKIAKVYGDGTQNAKILHNELTALRGAFEALSNRFGVHQDEVLNVAAAWSAAGASGIALARATQVTLTTMVLGEMEATKATEALIAIQAQYGLTTKQLSDTIAQLNIVENQTGISLSGLVEGFARAAGTARSAGVDTRHLAAMLAAITPAAGTASQAGNALKTVISRLLSPTKEAVQVLDLMGVNVSDLSWKSLNATQRLELMAKKFEHLDDAQKAVVSAVIASRYQINKFDVLMRDLASGSGFYQKALNATSDRTRYLRVAQQELNQVLDSSPHKFQTILVMLQNAAADIIQPFIPLMLSLANAVRVAVQWFGNLDPTIQKVVLGFLLFIAVVGPIVKYMGATTTLVAELVMGFLKLGGAALFATRFMGGLLLMPLSMLASGVSLVGGAGVVMARGMVVATVASMNFIRVIASGALMSLLRTLPWLFATAGTAVLMFGLRLLSFVGIFRTMLIFVTNGTLRMLSIFLLWNRLPAIVMGAMAGIRGVIMGIIPFLARFAPMVLSLLGGPWGVAAAVVVAVLYALRDRIAGWVRDVVSWFNQLPQGVVNAVNATVQVIAAAARQIYEWFSYINPFARHSPSLVDEVKRGMRVIKDEFGRLRVVSAPLEAAKAKLDAMKVALRAQQAVVQSWLRAVQNAGHAIDQMRDQLQRLEDTAQKLGDQLDAAKQRLQDFANAPIRGMRAMEDQIFANQMAQKRLRLEMLKIEQAVGPLDQLQNKMSKIQGEIERLSGEEAGLRAAGAGSDVLRTYDAQIKALHDQQRAISDQARPLADLQRQLDDLQRQGEILDLEKSLKFDPLLRQIDQLANGLRELPFDQIIAGVRSNRAEVDRLQASYDMANAAVERQRTAIEAADRARNAMNARYDQERAKLDKLQAAYSRYADMVNKAKQALSGMGRIPKPERLTPGAEAFLAAKGGNFPEVGGKGGIGREMQNIKDQSKLIDEYTKSIAQQTADMFGGWDLFKPLREGWSKAWAWVRDNVAPVVGGVVSTIRDALSGSGGFFSTITEKARPLINTIMDVGRTVWKWIGAIWKLIGPEVKKTVANLIKIVQDFWRMVGPQLAQFGELLQPFIEAFGHAWNLIKPILATFGVALLALVKIFWSMLNETIRPIFRAIFGVIGGLLEVLRGVIRLVLALINGDWKQAWIAAKEIVSGTFKAIWALIKGLGQTIWGLVKGFVIGVVNFFRWLRDQLVGHSVIPDMIRAIVAWFRSLPGMALKAVWGLIKMLGDWAKNAWNTAWSWMRDRWSAIRTWASGLPSSLYNTISSLIGRLGRLGWDAFTSFLGNLKNVWTKYIAPWLASIPRAAADKLRGVGSAVANAVRAAVKGAFDWINKTIIGRVNSITQKFGVTIPTLPSLAKGGVVPGKETKKDSVIIAARPGEGVLVPETTRALGGRRGIEWLNNMFRAGHPARAFGKLQEGMQHFDLGGIVRNIGSKFSEWASRGAGFALDNLLKPIGGAAREIMPAGFAEDYVVSILNRWRAGVQSWGDVKEGTWLGSFGPGRHPGDLVGAIKTWIIHQAGKLYQWGAAGPDTFDCSGLAGAVYGLLRSIVGAGAGKRFFTTTTISTAVPGLKAGLGPGLNIGVTAGTGHMAGNFAGQAFEATPPRVVIGSRAAPVVNFARKFHYDRGGLMPPGISMAYNSTGEAELVMSRAQWRALGHALRDAEVTALATLKVGRIAATAAANARSVAGSGPSDVPSARGQGGGRAVLHLHGDLSFPNVRDGRDAEAFISNLETIARG